MKTPKESDFFEAAASVWEVLRHGRYYLIAGILLGAIVGAGIALLSKPVYRSSVLIAPVQSAMGRPSLSPELVGVASLVGIGMSGQDNTEEAVALLSSRRLIYTFFAELELLPVLFDERWNNASGSWQVGEDQPSELEAFEYFSREVYSVRRDMRSGLITLTVDWYDPALAAQWANELVTLANRINRDAAIADGTNQLDFVKRQLEQTEELASRDVLYKIMEDQVKNIAVASTREEYAFKVIDPAVAADGSRPLKPRPALLVTTAAFIGLFGGILFLLVELVRRRLPKTGM